MAGTNSFGTKGNVPSIQLFVTLSEAWPSFWTLGRPVLVSKCVRVTNSSRNGKVRGLSSSCLFNIHNKSWLLLSSKSYMKMVIFIPPPHGGGKTYFCHGPLKSSRMIFLTGPKKPLGIQVFRIDWRGQQYSSIKIKCQNNFCHEDRFFIFQKSQKVSKNRDKIRFHARNRVCSIRQNP